MNVDIRVVPGAKKQEIKRDGQSLKIKLVSRAQEGKANRELVDYLDWHVPEDETLIGGFFRPPTETTFPGTELRMVFQLVSG